MTFSHSNRLPVSLAQMLRDPRLVPPYMFIGNDRHRRHGIDRKAIRRKSNGSCVQCERMAKFLSGREDKRDLTALDLVEDERISAELAREIDWLEYD